MSRNEFCDYFGIPYRTVQDWELGNRKCPEYLLNLMEYKLRTDHIQNQPNKQGYIKNLIRADMEKGE